MVKAIIIIRKKENNKKKKEKENENCLANLFVGNSRSLRSSNIVSWKESNALQHDPFLCLEL